MFVKHLYLSETLLSVLREEYVLTPEMANEVKVKQQSSLVSAGSALNAFRILDIICS